MVTVVVIWQVVEIVVISSDTVLLWYTNFDVAPPNQMFRVVINLIPNKMLQRINQFLGWVDMSNLDIS